MRLAAVGLPLVLFAVPAGAQSLALAPTPRPARLVWERTPVEPFLQDTLPRPTTGAGTGTYVGAAIGAGLGYLLVTFGCGMSEGSPCGGGTYLIGLATGGLLGAMIGSAFEGDRPPKPRPADTATEPPPP